jgi:glycosyltransferase involved in cell wall biosynthesis
MRILFVIPDLHYSGAGKQMTLLVPRLPRDRFETRVCVLGEEGAWAQTLRDAGIEVDVLGWTRPVDARPLWRLRRLIQSFRPDIIHAWRLPALRGAGLVAGRSHAVVASRLASGERARKWNPLDRWLLRRAKGVVATSNGEARFYERLGIAGEHVRLVRLGVSVGARPPAERSLLTSVPQLPPAARLIVCVGNLDRARGFREAIWAFDILKYIFDDLRLMIIGGGVDRGWLEAFASSLSVANRVHFLGPLSDVEPWLTLAEVVWVPSLADVGGNVVLEAMAAGRPVVASRQPSLSDLVVNQETGVLVPPRDKVALARQTRVLLDDKLLQRRLGEAGQHRVSEHFPVADLVAGHVGLYKDLAVD